MQQMIERAARVAPSPRQLAWQQTEFYAFIHFGMNTFTGREWGDGTESPALFDPGKLDAAQWAASAQSAGMRGVLLTCKHHDGFCLWPTATTSHSVASAPYKGGQGDVVRELSDACRAAGLKFGVYLSPWDRNAPCYGEGKAYDDFFVAQLTELLTGYGEIFSVWFDGACGEGKNGRKQVYDWERYYKVIRRLQPGAVINICGPDVRWCGNEAGICRESEWSVVPARLADCERTAALSQQQDGEAFRERAIHSTDLDLGSRERIAGEEALAWYPAEVDTSIRPGWFYHENEQPKPLAKLLEIYYASVGGNACLLLNLPPNRDGLLADEDVERLAEMGRYLRTVFACNLSERASVQASESAAGHPAESVRTQGADFWRPEEGVESAWLRLRWKQPQRFDHLVLMEQITEGQRIERFSVYAMVNGEKKRVAHSTVVGYKRILRLPAAVVADTLWVEIEASRLCPTLCFLGVYDGGSSI